MRQSQSRTKVIAISSGLGSIERTQRFGTPSYDISKAALNMAMRLLGHALSERRIAVLALSPGWVRTDMGGENADLEPAQSSGNMLKVIDALAFDEAAIGEFLGNDGKPSPRGGAGIWDSGLVTAEPARIRFYGCACPSRPPNSNCLAPLTRWRTQKGMKERPTRSGG